MAGTNTLIVVCVLLTFFCKTSIPDPTKIHSKLSTILGENGKANVIVSFRDGIMSTLDSVNSVRYNDRSSRNTGVKAALFENSEKSQAGVLQTLSTRSGEGSEFRYYKQYWSSNKILIKDATAEIINQVSEDPEVKLIYKLPLIRIPDNEVPYNSNSEMDELQWGLKKMQVPEAWEELNGNRGEGVIVGIIDSGVLSTHEALRDNFVGLEYGWYDPEFQKPEPYDDFDHGTHVTGTIAGSRGIGVAPGVKWMACRMCYENGCEAEGAMDCLQWMSCPTLLDGSKEDCSKAPHVINNSWGFLTEDVDGALMNDLDEDMMRWRAMRIIPVFALGNFGFLCLNIYPGSSQLVISVGATDENDKMPDFSSTGPGVNGSIKPDLVAPGVGILSSFPTADNSYRFLDGTSFAAPYVAGVVALLKTRDPDLTFEETYELLIQNVDKEIAAFIDTDSCPDRNTSVEIPNIYFGYGRVNALKAVRAQTLILNGRKK